MSESEFGGQVAVVTGGAEGIGFAISALLAERGARVCILDVDAAAMEDALERLSNVGSISAYQADVTDESAILAARDAILAEHGQVDALVNNAGIYPHATIREITEESWDRVFDVDVKGVFLCMRAFMDAMIEKRYGRMVTIVSEDAYMAKPAIGHYAAAKASLVSLIKTFALELAPHQVLCNGLSPGPVAVERAKGQAWLAEQIPQIPVLRAAEPEDMAEYVAFLASGRNRFMTGETIVANGGHIMV
jgi:3-oxoacyl-[acyl-carrier protein] reductase